jgi:Zn-dependent protease with chaperone function
MEAMMRSRLLMVGLGAIGFANGFFLAFGLYGLLAAVLHLIGATPPSLGLGILAGILAGTGVDGSAALRARNAYLAELGTWPHAGPGVDVAAWKTAASELAGRSELESAPTVRFAPGIAPNALVVAPRGLQPAIVVTEGLAAELSSAQQYAVLAHEVAHLEAGDLRATGFADAIWQIVGDLSEARGRLLWGPGRIFAALLPVIAIGLLGALLLPLAPESSASPQLGQVLLGLAIAIAGLYWILVLLGAVLASWQAFLQLFVYCTFFGPLNLIEAVLAWPTMLALSRLFSRTRVYAADARAVELTAEPEALIGALEAVEWVERSPAEAEFGRLRFSLFAAPPPPDRYLALIAWATGTHPSATRRIAKIREREAQERSRGQKSESGAVDSLEQSG